MPTRRARWPMVAALVLLIGLTITAGAVYLPDVISLRGQYYEGRPEGYWIRALTSPDVELRREAVRAVGSFGPAEAEESVPVLARMLLEDPDGQVRVLASLALTKLAPATRVAVPELARALADDDPMVRMNAATALFVLGPDARPALPALIASLDDERNVTNTPGFTLTVRERVILALGRAGAGTSDALSALHAALKTAKTEGTRRAAAQALGDLGPEARPAAADLRVLLRDEHEEVREAADEALRKIEG